MAAIAGAGEIARAAKASSSNEQRRKAYQRRLRAFSRNNASRRAIFLRANATYHVVSAYDVAVIINGGGIE